MVKYSSPNYKTIYSTLKTFKTGQITPPRVVLEGGFDFFFFLFISVESLKNYNKSQKNYKIKKSIL